MRAEEAVYKTFRDTAVKGEVRDVEKRRKRGILKA